MAAGLAANCIVKVLLLLGMSGCLRYRAMAKVYMALVEGDPVVAYDGHIPDFAATAVPPGKKVDPSSAQVQSYISHLTNRHDDILARTFGQHGEYRKLYSYHHTLNGFAVDITPAQVDLLVKAEGVRYIEQDCKVKKMTTHTPEFLRLTSHVWPLHGGPGNAGEGVIIGIVDTGINPFHPSFSSSSSDSYGPHVDFMGDCEIAPEFPRGSCNKKIIAARHFSAAASANGDFNASSLGNNSPYDTEGHGSHVASIAAGNYGVPVIVNGFDYGSASGMAPRARLAIYKALYSTEGYMADIIAAIDKAVEDGVDILSLSLGPSSPDEIPSSPFLEVFDVALLFAVKAGVFVAQAAGNSGPSQASIMSFSPWITTVGSGTTDRRFQESITLGSQHKVAGVGLSPATPGGVYTDYKMVFAADALINDTSSPSSDCILDPSTLDVSLLQDSILICTYPYDNSIIQDFLFENLEKTAKIVNAAGLVVVANPEEGPFDASGLFIFNISVILISDLGSSLALLEYYNASTLRDNNGKVLSFDAKGSIQDGRLAVYDREAPMVNAYSSRGPGVLDNGQTPADLLKPDILAPGELIWAAWNPVISGIDNFQGTSMATPHIAGIAALIKQNNPSWSPAAITSAMVTTGATVDSRGMPIFAELSQDGSDLHPATPFDYGGGLVNASAAMDPGLIFDADFKSYINFLCSVPGIDPSSVHSATGRNCTNVLEWPSELNTPSITIANLVASRKVIRILTNVAATERYTASIIEPVGVFVSVNPSDFTIQEGGTQNISVSLTAVQADGNFHFGQLILTGVFGHRVQIPISVCTISAIPT
ncbi:hypothetical protein O6H91_19G034600 [Diphasiastrum complanatum]|uniref:Uncharacterized protein n=1 Tax=Diphasiastrum complanatum TaxID=34168 RepID=A0ACC2AU77_DIPCM|nr:hypothetical protein O6H91_19G034600 [Diphasiastrum complanatum]